jgi:PAS domain S-box-containing protein
MRKSVNEILLDLEIERTARKESERILESKNLEVYEQRLEIDRLQKKLDKDPSIGLSQISKIQRIQQKVFEAHPFSILIYSLSSLKILNVNETAVNNYGYSKSEFYKLSIIDLHDDEDNYVVIKHIDAIKKGNYKTKIWRHFKKNGEVAFVKITGVTIEFDGESARIVIVEDVTELKALEVKNEIQQKKIY